MTRRDTILAVSAGIIAFLMVAFGFEWHDRPDERQCRYDYPNVCTVVKVRQCWRTSDGYTCTQWRDVE